MCLFYISFRHWEDENRPFKVVPLAIVGISGFGLKRLLNPLILLIIPFGGNSLNRVHAHIQHSFDLFSLPLLIEGVWLGGIN